MRKIEKVLGGLFGLALVASLFVGNGLEARAEESVSCPETVSGNIVEDDCIVEEDCVVEDCVDPDHDHVTGDCVVEETVSGNTVSGSCGSSTENVEKSSSKKSSSSSSSSVAQTPANNYGVFMKSVKANVDTAIAKAVASGNSAAPIAIDTGIWISFKGDVYQKLQDSGLPVQITFRYQGTRYRVDIPAGADLMSLVDENGYCGFLNLMAHFGGTEL